MTITLRQHSGKVVSFFLVALTFIVYLQVQGFAFINYDDPNYIIENRFVTNGITSEGLAWAFTEFHFSNWHPITWLSHMLDVHLFGLDPGWHHLVNLFFHLANTLLLFYVLRSMTGSLWRSALVAALFAWHPLHVESVAWVSERKDVLSTFFWLFTIHFYCRYVKQPSAWRYLLVFTALALGLMSKPMVVTLPFVLLLLDFWPLSRLGSRSTGSEVGEFSLKHISRLIWEKIPFFVLIAISSVVTFFAQKHGGAVVSMESIDVGARVGNAIHSYGMYIVKMFMPFDLAVLYPHPKTLSLLKIIALTIILAGISGFVVRLRITRPYLLVGWFWFLGTMVPVIGLIQVGAQAMADRYTYIPFIGLFIMISWGAGDLLEKFHKGKAWAVGFAFLILPAMMAITWTQLGYFKNSVTLFEHALAVTTSNPIAHNNLGKALDDEGDKQGAVENFLMAIQINPEYALAHNNLGKVLDGQGKTQEAIEHLQKALQIRPNFDVAHNNLGNALDRQGQTQSAIEQYLMALEINPDFPVAHNNAGLAFEKLGNREMAIGHYRQAIEGNPGFASAHHNLGVALFRDGQMEVAIMHLQKAVQIDPDYILARQNLEKVLELHERKINR